MQVSHSPYWPNHFVWRHRFRIYFTCAFPNILENSQNYNLTEDSQQIEKCRQTIFKIFNIHLSTSISIFRWCSNLYHMDSFWGDFIESLKISRFLLWFGCCVTLDLAPLDFCLTTPLNQWGFKPTVFPYIPFVRSCIPYGLRASHHLYRPASPRKILPCSFQMPEHTVRAFQINIFYIWVDWLFQSYYYLVLTKKCLHHRKIEESVRGGLVLKTTEYVWKE